MKNTPLFFTVLLSMLFVCDAGYAQTSVVNLESLLTEITDRESVARYPDPWYTTRQFSSYDRNSVEPGDSTWFANWDRSQFIRTEENGGRREYVLMDAGGPGAIVRFWMTFAGNEEKGRGILRVYFDHREEPVIEGPAFDVISGGLLTGEPLSSSVSPETDYGRRGHNLYLPLPFAEHCKITYESDNIQDAGAKTGGESVYYNINYREYEKGTEVKTFSHDQLEEAGDLLQQVQERLKTRDKEREIRSLTTESGSFAETVAGGDSFKREIEGPAAIRKLAIGLDAENRQQALRSTVIDISFDGQRTVWSPVGDFFGTGYRYRPSDTWYTTVTDDGELKAYWIMPFSEKAVITVRNLGDRPVDLEGSFEYTDWEWDSSGMYFGASWHQYSDLYTGEQKNNEGGGDPFDINFTRLSGGGVYLGDAVTLFNTAYSWWGEGDEKIYIDGEDFPSHFGTGTEDYYGYAWVRPEVFTNHPFISQPDGSGNITPGYTVNIRFRALDAIPFREELKVDMEMWHWTSTVIDYAPVSFYYLKPGAETDIEPDRENAGRKVALKRSDLIPPDIREGRIEGENMVVDSLTGGAIAFQYLREPELSNNKQLWWREGEQGDLLKASFQSDREGSFAAEGKFVIAPDYGTVRITLNGQTVLDSFDGYNEEVSTRSVDLGTLPIRRGDNEIRVEITGHSPTDDKAFFGLDHIRFGDY